MSYEDEFAQALRGAAASAPQSEPTALAAGAATRGRALRRRRRTVRLGVCAAVVASGLATAALLPGAGTVTPADDQPISAAFMERTVRSLLPPGSVTGIHGSGIGTRGFGSVGPTVALMLDVGHGPVQFSLTTERMPLPVDADTPGTECLTSGQPAVCTRTEGADGTIVLLQRTQDPGEAGGRKGLLLQTTTAEGRRIRLDLSGQDPEASLTVAQLTALATSPEWDPVFSALAVPGYPKSAFQGMPADRIAATGLALLPPGVTGKAAEGRFGNGEQRIALTGDGREAQLGLSVHLHDQITPQAFESGAQPGELTRAADGTAVIARRVRDNSDDTAPVKSWSVEALHADGTRVGLVQTGPGVWPDVPPMDGREVLSLDQLVAMAGSPAWRG
ncbi:hypothetical protein [Kitasatospora sp. NPDC004289]